MWLFKKKKEEKERKRGEISELPELPELPPLPKIWEAQESSQIPLRRPEKIEKPSIRDELPPLPSIMIAPRGEKISDAVKESLKEPFKFSPQEGLKEPRTREIEGEIETASAKATRIKEIMPGVKAEPVFVRIDKYQNSLTKFQEIKKKLLEIESLLTGIKELKGREDAELQEWQQEIDEAKANLNSIDKTIFSKLEE